MKRSKHSLSHYKLATTNMGILTPIGLYDVLPGDTIQQSTSMLVRFAPLLAPVMHPISVRIHHWFVPFRLLWEGWEDFITGGPDGSGSALPYPTNSGSTVVNKGTLLDYLGIPPEIYSSGMLSLLPVRAYNMIFNEFYRDEDLVDEAGEDDLGIQNIAWEKDYFTTARPWTQKGADVTLPLGTEAPIQARAAGVGYLEPIMRDSTTGAALVSGDVLTDIGGGTTVGASSAYIDPNGSLFADLSGATSANINDIRRAFALQRYQEARAQYGSRYTEYLRYLGVRPSDARLQRPEYLGGGKQTVAFSEVLATAGVAGTSPVVGDMKGHGISALRSNRFRYFAEEHGIVMTLLSLRPRTMYTQGVDRSFRKRFKEDYYQKELELIGQQDIQNAEVYATGVNPADSAIFGYQDRYSEYRHQKSNVAGDFRDTLNHWHLSRAFAGPAAPALNGDFVSCDPTDRIFASLSTDSIWCMINHSIQARRLVGKKTIGRVI